VIKRLFIANRGEIALRIVRAAHDLGMEAVLAVSTADKESTAAKEADSVVVIGPAPAKASYLNGPGLVHAALSSRCDALHPGYGFLSERATFARLCEDNGLNFVGPRAETIEAVGDKLAARRLASTAGIPMVAGTDKVSTTEEALDIAAKIGYPVITKASAGGGGRGMRVARSASDLQDSFDRSSQEAKEAFGDGTLYLERFVEHARHVEVQVLGDGHGEVLHFGERDCTLQRRYQKMMEEAPAAALSPSTRARIHHAAIDLLRPLKYRNAGTVEFLFDPRRDEFYFMEVNARIQVEHPVSEMICGVDLIQLQLRVASEGRLPISQSDVHPGGHAIELRILAEDPRHDFQPSPGKLTDWYFDVGRPEARLDSAMHVGATIPPYYDSMVGKLLVKADTRDAALGVMADVLERSRVSGVHSNIDLLRYLVRQPDVISNSIDTRWAERVLMPQFLKSK
jgi:acetyl-CoA carboxylase biotin carboxylase subunit